MTSESGAAEAIAPGPGFDPTMPNRARVYDYLLGGKDNFAADRQAAKALLGALPDVAHAARTNRAFAAAAVRHVASQGVSQFVDIGAGLPTVPNVHQSARMAMPSARVVYVDNDPVVVTHARALLTTDDLVTVVAADARDHAAILGAPEFTSLIDLSMPVCVMFVSMLHFLPGAEADATVAAFRERMAPGSYLIISAGLDSERNVPVREQIHAAYRDKVTLTGRTRPEIAAYFGDFDLVEPGLVPLAEWPLDVPDGPHSPPQPARTPSGSRAPSQPIRTPAAAVLAGIGRKPG